MSENGKKMETIGIFSYDKLRGNEALNSPIEKVSNAQEHTALHWPKGIVSYHLDNLTYDDYIAQRVRIAMNILESASCVKFKRILNKPVGNMSWIHFSNSQGERNCVHEPKIKNDGEIVLVLGFDCLKENEILHTLLHAIGFKDEVSHPQRDQFIRVMWNNIQPEYRYLYRKRSKDEETSQLLVEYDPLSIMHFHDRAFSMNGQATIMPLTPGLLISPSDDLSQLDKMKLRLLFDHECNKRKVGDMIDTCKMLLSNNDSPNDSKKKKEDSNVEDNVDDVNEVEDIDRDDDFDKDSNVDKVDDVDKADDADKVDDTDKVDDVDKVDYVDKVDDVDKDDEFDKNNSVDKVNEVIEDDVDNIDDVDEHSNVDKVDEVDMIDNADKGDNVDEVHNVHQTDDDNQVEEINDSRPKNMLNKELPSRLSYLNKKKKNGESTSVEDSEYALYNNE